MGRRGRPPRGLLTLDMHAEMDCNRIVGGDSGREAVIAEPEPREESARSHGFRAARLESDILNRLLRLGQDRTGFGIFETGDRALSRKDSPSIEAGQVGGWKLCFNNDARTGVQTPGLGIYRGYPGLSSCRRV